MQKEPSSTATKLALTPATINCVIDPNIIPEHTRRVTTYDYFRILCDRRIRYYDHYKAAKILGKTAGARLVVEVILLARYVAPGTKATTAKIVSSGFIPKLQKI